MISKYNYICNLSAASVVSSNITETKSAFSISLAIFFFFDRYAESNPKYHFEIVLDIPLKTLEDVM